MNRGCNTRSPRYVETLAAPSRPLFFLCLAALSFFGCGGQVEPARAPVVDPEPRWQYHDSPTANALAASDAYIVSMESKVARLAARLAKDGSPEIKICVSAKLAKVQEALNSARARRSEMGNFAALGNDSGVNKDYVVLEGFYQQARAETAEANSVCLRPAMPGSGSYRAFAGVTFGLGAVGLGVGTVAGVVALSRKTDLDSRCMDKSCYPQEQAVWNSAKTASTASTIGFIAGGVCVAAGTLTLLLQPSGGTAGASARSAMPALAVGPSTLHLVGEF